MPHDDPHAIQEPAAWETYKLHVRQGRIIVPIGNNFQAFSGQTLKARGRHVAFTQGPVKERTFLDDLHTPAPARLFDFDHGRNVLARPS